MCEKPFKFLLLLAFSNTVMAQTTVSGTVTDADGPLIGATIKIVGKATGTITDFDGNYSLEVALWWLHIRSDLYRVCAYATNYYNRCW